MYLLSYLEHAVQTYLHEATNLEINKFLQLFSEIMTDNTSNQSWVKFDETDGSSSNNVTRSQPINIDPKRINEDKYTGVHISLDKQYAKILKEPLLLQKKTIHHINTPHQFTSAGQMKV